ncbi:MAG: 1-acyl-sn-glycerol-3-phosphate acyltransferase, partial [Pseudomonadota bacterium]
MLLVRSLIFQVWMYGLMAILGVVFAPLAIWSRDGAYFAISIYLRLVFWGLQAICGLTAETRGEIPEGDVLIAAKHQSFLDVLILVRDLPAAKFVMKRSLVWAPILGFYALRIGASPVTRGKGAASVEEMVEEAEKRRALSGQLVIYPQGTRV